MHPCLIFLIVCLLLNAIMTLVTESWWQSSSPWRTDHKNLEYIRSAKCLSSRQAWWTLFFICLHFSISYNQSFKNIKPDAFPHIIDHSKLSLSHFHSAQEPCCFNVDLRDRIKGLHGHTRGNTSINLPTRSFVFAWEFTVRRHLVGSLFQGSLPSRGQSYHVSH